MSAIFKTQGGGGGFFPSIFVTGLSETDTVYATMGSKTVYGKWETRTVDETEVSGFLISPLRELGTWTVTASNGEKTVTQDVLVDVATEYEIEIDFDNLLLTENWHYILLEGKTSPSEDTGIKSYHIPTMDEPYFEASCIYVDVNNQGNFGAEIDNPIDFTNVSKVRFVVDSATVIGSTSYWVGLCAVTAANAIWGGTPRTQILQNVTSPTVFELDTSEVTGNRYLGFRIYGGYKSNDSHVLQSIECSSVKLVYA